MKQVWQILALGAVVLLGVAIEPASAQLSFGNSDFGGWESIATAAKQNKADDVQQLLIDHGDPDATDESGRPALIWAVTYDNIAMAKMLLDYRGHVDVRDSFGNTALHWAAQRGEGAMIRFLIERHATVDALNRQGETPLIQAVDHGKLEAVRVLLAAGADPHREDYTGRDAINWAAGKPAILDLLKSKAKS